MDEKINELESMPPAPQSIRRSVEGNLNMFRLIGDVVAIFTGGFGQTVIEYTELLNENASKPTDSAEKTD